MGGKRRVLSTLLPQQEPSCSRESKTREKLSPDDRVEFLPPARQEACISLWFRPTFDYWNLDRCVYRLFWISCLNFSHSAWNSTVRLFDVEDLIPESSSLFLYTSGSQYVKKHLERRGGSFDCHKWESEHQPGMLKPTSSVQGSCQWQRASQKASLVILLRNCPGHLNHPAT